MHILLVHRSKEVRDLIAFTLEGQIGAQVVHKESASAAMELLLEDQPLNVIVCDDSTDNTKLFKYLVSVASEIPVVILRSDDRGGVLAAFPDLTIVGYANSAKAVDELTAVIRECVDKGVIKAVGEEDEYCRIRTELLLKVVPLKADIYIRLSNIKYIKLFKRGDVFDASDLERYLVEKNINFLYLKRNECGEFIQSFRSVLAKILSAEEPAQAPAPILAVSIHDATVQLSRQLGFTPEVQDMVRDNVKVIVGGIQKSQRLTALVRQLKIGAKTYLPAHSVLVSHVACGFARKIDWFSDTTYEKLIFAALMHDITLKDEAATVQNPLTMPPAITRNFPSKELREQYLHHPIEGAALVRTFHEIPGDVDTIIIQHHERADGTGFPRQLNALKIAPLSALFILTHDVVSSFLHPEGNVNAVIERYRTDWALGPFKRIAPHVEI